MSETTFKKTLALTPDGDVAIDDHNRPFFVRGEQAAAQQLKTLLKTTYGESPFHPNRGLRIFEVTGAPDAVLKREIRFALHDHDWVESVEQVTIDEIAERSRAVTIMVNLIDGSELEFEVTYG